MWERFWFPTSRMHICSVWESAKKIRKKYGQTIVMITHDDEIAQVADRILVIEDGQVVDFR